MAKPTLKSIVRYCDQVLRTHRIRDYDGAANGLQVENRGQVTRLGAAVDASLATVQMAIEAGVNLLIVHHGLFWGPAHPWTGRRMELIRLLVQHDVAIYSSHLPLDIHPRLGNNALLCAALRLTRSRPFFSWKKQMLGRRVTCSLGRKFLSRRLAKATGYTPHLIPAGPATCRRVGIVTGGAGAELRQAAEEGVDTFITGEGPHWTYALAEELGINVFYAGHYATETFGVRALAEHLSSRFKLPWDFLDHPTGL